MFCFLNAFLRISRGRRTLVPRIPQDGEGDLWRWMKTKTNTQNQSLGGILGRDTRLRSRTHLTRATIVFDSVCIPTWTVGMFCSNTQDEYKRTLHFQNDTENKCGVLRTSHLHQSIETLSKFCTHLTETRYVLRESHGRFRDDNPTRPKLCAAMAVVILGNGYSAGWFHVKLCVKCTLHTCYRLFLR
jgi:hypothetical protein